MTTGDFGDGEDRPINKSYWPMRISAKHLFGASLISLRGFLSDARNWERQETEYGMLQPISARDAVFTRYGCSLEEAERALACIDLAELQAWDETALMDAVVVGYGGDDERVAQDYGSRESLARRISLAVKFEKAPELMSPADGVFLLCRANIPFFPPLLVAVASRQLLSAETRHNYFLLMRLLEPGETSAITDKAGPMDKATAEPATNWRMKIQTEAYEHWTRLLASGCSPSVHSILDYMAKWCEKNNVRTDTGIFPRAGHIKNTVLCARVWTPPTISREEAKKRVAQAEQVAQAKAA